MGSALPDNATRIRMEFYDSVDGEPVRAESFTGSCLPAVRRLPHDRTVDYVFALRVGDVAYYLRRDA